MSTPEWTEETRKRLEAALQADEVVVNTFGKKPRAEIDIQGDVEDALAELTRLRDENERLTAQFLAENRDALEQEARAKKAEALAERERARADDHNSARQSEKERADYAEAKVVEACAAVGRAYDLGRAERDKEAREQIAERDVALDKAVLRVAELEAKLAEAQRNCAILPAVVERAAVLEAEVEVARLKGSTRKGMLEALLERDRTVNAEREERGQLLIELAAAREDAADHKSGVEEANRRWIESHEQVRVLRNALDAISRGDGRYGRDPLTHASNTIEDMKTVAVAALRSSDPEPTAAAAPDAHSTPRTSPK